MSSAKAFGLDRSDKVFLAVTITGMLFAVTSIVTNEYSMREVIFFGLLACFLVVLFYTNRQLSPILLFLVLGGAKYKNKDTIFKALWYSWLIGFASNILLSVLGIIPTYSRYDTDHGGIMRYALGYKSDNMLHFVLFLVVTMWGYTCKKKKVWMFLVWAGINNIFFWLTNCRGGFLSTYLSLLVWFVLPFIERRKVLAEIYDRLMKVLAVIPLTLSILMLLFVDMSKDFWILMNSIFTSRVAVAERLVINYNPKLLGQNLDLVRWTVDNAYIHILYQYGIIYFVLFFSLYVWLFLQKSNDFMKEKTIALMIMYIGLIEQFVQNPFMNYTLIMIAVMMWKKDTIAKVIERVLVKFR
jgi:hypothetical protein